MMFYRYVDRAYEDGPHISIEQWLVVKKTPKGTWIALYGIKRWVKDGAFRQFACSTKELAWASFTARKKRQRSIYLARAKSAEKVLNMIERVDNGVDVRDVNLYRYGRFGGVWDE